MDYYSSSLGHYTDPTLRRESTQSHDSSHSYASSPSLNQRPRLPQDFPSSGPRISMPSQTNLVDNSDLTPPTRPFGGTTNSNRSSLISLSTNGGSKAGDVSTSLSVNYLPTKFSRPHSPGVHPRRVQSNSKLRQDPVPGIRGGGREAFRASENRMPGGDDEDYDGVQVSGWWSGRKGRKGRKARLRWNRFKWILFLTNIVFTLYSIAALIFCLLTYLNVWHHAEVVLVANTLELTISTVAACLGVLTSLLGWAGILLNNRSFLAVYTLFLWVCFGLLLAPGYMSYRTRTFNIEGKMNKLWSQGFDPDDRLRIQDKLQCCGYYSPFVEATVSQTCYSRSLLPGCKAVLINFERSTLKRWYIVAFGLVPLQLGTMVAALLCSNHVTYRFGKGMMPKAYRLSPSSMVVIMDNYASQLAEQYGDDVASEVLARVKTQPTGTSFGTSTAIGSYGAPSPLGGSMQAESSAPSGYNSSRNSGYATYGTSAFPLNTMNSGGYGGFAAEDGRRM